jgi:DNA-binding MarR family transcriptional regulator
MAVPRDLRTLDDLLNELAKLYQFRSLDDRMYEALTVSQSYCLRILYFQGPRPMGELATELDVRLSTMTGIVDQLEARGLVGACRSSG